MYVSYIREIKIHVYRRIENKQIKTVPNDSYG